MFSFCLRVHLQKSIFNYNSFHTTSVLRKAWSLGEDTRLRQRYDRLGPAWHLIQLAFKGRRPQECRRRWLTLSGIIDHYTRLDARTPTLLHDGYEPHGKKWLKFPIEDPSNSPFATFCSKLPTFSRTRYKRRSGWPEIEQMALQQGVEEFGENWETIAKEMHRRTEGQCRRFLEHRNASSNKLKDSVHDKIIEAQAEPNKRTIIYDPNSGKLKPKSRFPN